MSTNNTLKKPEKTYIKLAQQALEPQWSDLNRLIKQSVNTEASSELPNEVINHLLNNAGKRLRPTIILLLAKALNSGSIEEQIELAAVIELTHTATLLHDDVIDESMMRRNKQTANSIWGNHAPVLAGDFLYSRSIQIMVKSHNVRIRNILAKATSMLIEGELIQLKNARNFISHQEYIDTIYRKTAVVFESSCQSSAIIADTKEETIEHCRLFGKHFGIAFQIVDDILDYTAQDKTLGKNTGDDLKQGKYTLPLIHALAEITDEQKTNFIKRIGQGKASFTEIKALIDSTHSIETCYTEAEQHHNLALSMLDSLPQNTYTEHLIALLKFNFSRLH